MSKKKPGRKAKSLNKQIRSIRLEIRITQELNDILVRLCMARKGCECCTKADIIEKAVCMYEAVAFGSLIFKAKQESSKT